jgi:hypothetical protein
MNILALTTFTHTFCGDCTAATTQLEELAGFADEKGSLYWKAFAAWLQGWLLALAGKTAETGATLFTPTQLPVLADVHASLGHFDESRRSIDEAIAATETSKEIWFEGEVHRVAGEIALKSPEPNAAKAEVHLQHALAVARQQQAKSWELRAAISLARLWRDQGKP